MKHACAFVLAAGLAWFPWTVSAVTLSAFETTAVVEVISYNEGEEYAYLGSGFLTDFTTGCVVTAAHVILDEQNAFRDVLLVAFQAGTEEEEVYAAIPLITYADVDTAVVCINDEAYVPRFRHYFQLEPENLNHVQVGDQVTGLGYPSTGGDTLTAAFGQVTGFMPVIEERDLLKTDLVISGGISGGPVITESKDVIGMVISTATEEETGGVTTYAVSSDLLTAALEEGAQAILEAGVEEGLLEPAPEDCFQISVGGHYLSGGVEYYDSRCSERVDKALEATLQLQYVHWCASTPDAGYLENAAYVLNQGDQVLDRDDWRVYLNELCGPLDPEDPYNFYTPGQDLGARLIKSPEFSAVYAVLGDGKRHAFPSEAVYRSWFGDDFSSVETVTAEDLAAYPLGKNITFHPGTLVKIPSIPDVYLVSDDQELRWIMDEPTAQALYGDSWNTHVHDVSESLFSNYGTGDGIQLP